MTQRPPGPPYDPQPGQPGQPSQPGQPGQPGQPSHPYGAAPGDNHGRPRPQGKGLAIAALVLGVLALLTCWTIVGGLLLGLLALVLGLVALGRARKGRAAGKGLAIAGVALGVVGAGIAGVLLAAGLSFLDSPAARELQECLQRAGGDQAAVDRCRAQLEDDLGGSQR